MSKMALAAVLGMALASGFQVPGISNERGKRSDKIPLTDEQLEWLRSLSKKEKKLAIAELRRQHHANKGGEGDSNCISTKLDHDRIRDTALVWSCLSRPKTLI